MTTIQLKAASVHEKLAELSVQFPAGDCVLVSIEGGTFNMKGGQAVEVSVDVAARHIVEGSHRLGTKVEVDTFRLEQFEAGREIQARAAKAFAQVYRTEEKARGRG